MTVEESVCSKLLPKRGWDMGVIDHIPIIPNYTHPRLALMLEVCMGLIMRPKEEVLKDFEAEYQTLVDLGEDFRIKCELYATASTDTQASDLDDTYTHLKKSMKRIRKLAREVRK